MMLNPLPADYQEDIDPATGLPRQRSADVMDAPPVPGPPPPRSDALLPAPPALTSVPLETSPVDGGTPPALPAPDADLTAALSGAGGPGVVDDGSPVIPPNKPLPDLTPTTAGAPPDVAPPAGARQKFTRTLESPEDHAIAKDHGNLAEAAVTAEQNASQVRQRALEEEVVFRAQQAQDARDHAKRVEDAIKEHDAEVEAAIAKKQEYFDAARGAKFHDLWAERSTGDRVLGAVAVFLGGLGGGQNQAMQILDTQMKHAYDAQAADIEGKWKLYAEQSKDADAAARGKDEALANLKLIQSARYEAAADHLAELKTRQGIPAEQAQSDKDVVAIRQKALAERMQVAKETRDKVEWDTYGKHAGTGGGGGGDAAMQRFVSAVNQLKAGEDIPPEVYTLGRHAGYKPNQIGSEIDRLRNSGSKEAKGGLGNERQDSKEANDWAKQNGLPAIAKQQRELSELSKTIADNPTNPLNQALAIESAVSAARHGAASKQALSLALGHLGGSLDNAEGVISKWRDGQLSEGKKKNFLDFVNGQVAAAQAAGKEKYDAFNKYVDSAPAAMKPDLLASRSKLFSGMAGFGGASESPRAAPKPDRAAKAKLANEALTDPAATPAERARAIKTLQDLGVR